ncbi:LysR substrate-binding domain-containing protein [Octadecabacter sp. 1_MG-2023]|uniref:LysR substrate-binding domain-containing protein n=1 Tax=unclassified Octadecabacter TaxID=196158 RepID=UPI001C0819CC|nr:MULTISPECIES: LysR substrate-binding domain-containing protein [unclassified Octadecabacter]MBU2994512.1 LysR family transcriptional regulator [Octadecabacter sp. B2R22]MDO6734195.1 LysR substrate-binding domain-containing protein [Octadecabacter sp. 1_MG-2023]
MSLPPISALIVLDALARTGTVRDAAVAVRLSQSAVSHKLKALEAQLGFQLTTAKGRGVVLTSDARRYVAAIRPALSILHEAHSGLDQAKGPLEIAVVSGFAATWLAPRLTEFRQRHPAISLKLSSVAAGEDIPDCDLAIVFTDRPPEGAIHLFEVTFFPVCSPDFLHARAPLMLENLTPDLLLHLNSQDDWRQWLALKGQSLEVGEPSMIFTGLLAMYASAEAGMGLCLGDAVTSDHALRSGRLVRPFTYEIQAPASYWVTPPPNGFTAPAATFAQWLRAKFQSSSPKPVADMTL